MTNRGVAGLLGLSFMSSVPCWLMWLGSALGGSEIPWMVLPVFFVVTGVALLSQVAFAIAVADGTSREDPWGWLGMGWLVATGLGTVIGILRGWTTG